MNFPLYSLCAPAAAGWKDLLVCGYADRVVVDFRCQDADGNRMPSVTPDFVLVRYVCITFIVIDLDNI